MKIIRISADDLTYYHGTDSEPFNSYDPSKAKKGKEFYNPLGDAMYVTNKKDFAKNFGKNVYPVKIPPDAVIKKINPSKAQSAISDIVGRALKTVGIDIWNDKLPWEFKITYRKCLEVASYSPYDSIMEVYSLFEIYFPEKAEEYGNAIADIATKKFSKFDVVIFVGTNDPNNIYIGETPTQEILIFNKEFQKIFIGDFT